MKIRHLAFLVATSISIPAAAHAFPLAEGTSAIGALSGAVGSALAVVAPAISRTRQGKLFTAIVLALAFTSLAFAGLYYSSASKGKQWELAVRQNVPTLSLAESPIPTISPDSPTNKELSWARTHNLFVDLHDYQRGSQGADAQPVYLNKRHDENYQPSKIPSFARDNLTAAIDYALRKEAPLLLISEYPTDIIQTAKKIVEQGGLTPKGILVTGSAFRSQSEYAIPYLPDSEDIFSQNLIEIRPALSVQSSHTLANAEPVSFYDIILMRDEDLRKHFTWPIVITSYEEIRYKALNDRLMQAGLEPWKNYSFYKGGLNNHYETKKLGLVPDHYNQAITDFSKLMDVAFLTGRLRFICTRGEACLENIPQDMRIDIPFRDKSRSSVRAQVENLDPTMIYTAISNDQETSGNAQLVGWWLINSDHNYIGEAVNTARFSPNLFWDKMRNHLGASTTYDDWKDRKTIEIFVIDKISEYVRSYGWPLTFLSIGIILRLLLLPAQLLSSTTAFGGNTRGILSPLSAIVLISTLLWSYSWLSDAIRFYAVVPHSTMESLFQSGSVVLHALLALALLSHISLSMPHQKKLRTVSLALIIVLFLFGFFSSIPAPLAAFLIGGEIIAIGSLLPMQWRLRQTQRLAKNGIFTSPNMQLNDELLPEKWLLAEKFRPGQGFLIRLRDYNTSAVLHMAMKLPDGRLIVRSASTGREEQLLGGFHESLVIPKSRDALEKAITSLHQMGCSHAWIQPFIECDESGLLMSIDADGRRSTMTSGPGNSATEGSKLATKLDLNDKTANPRVRRAKKLLRQAETHFSGPVLLEVGFKADKIFLFQVRRQDVGTAAEVALYPHGIEGVQLAENFIARCSRLTGTVLEQVTSWDFVYVRGFLYRRTQTTRPLLPYSSGKIAGIERDVIEAFEAAQDPTPTTLAKRLHALREAIHLYSEVYRATQARRRPQEIRTRLVGGQIVLRDGHELEISGTTSVPGALGHNFGARPTRDVLHDMSVLLSASICFLVAKICDRNDAPGHLDIRELLDPEFLPAPDYRDNQPLTKSQSASIIVPGLISGAVVDAKAHLAKQADRQGLILVAEEIGSEWVRYLHGYAGIVTTYGDANSHLGLSARALNIPYRKLSSEEVRSLLSSGVAHIE